MPTVTTSQSYLQELGHDFVDQCMKFVYHNSYDTKSYISAANEIENSIFEREWHIEHDGDYQHGVGSFDPNEMWFIGESWWTQYDDLDTKEEQDVVLNYIKDVFPDTWRP
jgi:hypothetical protein